MSCYSPLRAIVSKRDPVDGKKFVKILGGDSGGNTAIPCGKCQGCKLDKAHDTANRCMLEAKQWKHNYFLTLTYDNDSLPYTSTGYPTLVPNDVSKFMKDLRMYYSHHFQHDNIRFYACGEYGDKTYRPHYHLIVFNLPVDDLTYLKQNFNGHQLFTSQTLENIWKKGFVVIGNVTYESAGYTARYTMKKQTEKRDSSFFEENGIAKEFVRMSRMPGIGRKYYDDNKEQIYKEDGFLITTDKGSRFVRPPKYFDRLYEEENPTRLDLLKERRAEHILAYDKMIREDLKQNPLEYKQRQFEITAKKALALKRNKVV